MSIRIEIFHEDEDFKKISHQNQGKNISIINNYFQFDLNDIELNKFQRILREGKFCDLIQSQNLSINIINDKLIYNPEDYLGKNEILEKNVYEDFNEIYSKISDCFLNVNSYPYYKNTIFDDMKNKLFSYKNSQKDLIEIKYKQIYFLILFLSKRKIILRKIKEFYRKKFASNFQNKNNKNTCDNKNHKNSLDNSNLINNNNNKNNPVSEIFNYFSYEKKIEEKNLNKNQQNHQIEKDTNDITNTITLDILKSEKFKEFSTKLSEWYSLAESITLNLGLLNDYFGFKFNFDEDKFSLHGNYKFSLETFAKKNILKLISYTLKKMTFNPMNLKEFNYKRLMLLFASTFTYGISLKDFIFKDFKQVALLVRKFF